jgi:arylsulfatase A
MILRWPVGVEGGREVSDMVHFSDWFPTILSLAGVPVPPDLELDGVDVVPAIRGERGRTCTRRFWQWNRYTPEVTCNAAARDGDWKLVRPVIREAMAAPCCDPWLRISMYEPERLIETGPIKDPEPARTLPSPPAPELYNIAEDPLETTDLSERHPDIAHRLLRDLENWFEDVERDRAAIDDVW